jgi:hypothetical protein
MGQGRRQFTEEFKREAVGVTRLQWFHYRGTAWTSTTGRIIVLYLDEVHEGHAGAPTGFVYSMLYVDPSLIAAAGRDLVCGDPVFDDPALRRVLANAFVDFPQPIEDLTFPTFVTALAEALSPPSVKPARPTSAASSTRGGYWREPITTMTGSRVATWSSICSPTSAPAASTS